MPPKSKPKSQHQNATSNNSNNKNASRAAISSVEEQPQNHHHVPLIAHPHVYISNAETHPSMVAHLDYVPVEGALKPHAFKDNVSHGSNSACFLQLRHYIQSHILPKKEKELQIGIERIFYGHRQTSMFSGAGAAEASSHNNNAGTAVPSFSSPLSLDRKNPTCLTLLINKVTTDWSKPGVVNTRELRSQPSLLRDVVTVLESIIFLVYDDSQVPNLQIHPPMREIVRQCVAGLTAFCSRACLFGFASAMEKKPICVSAATAMIVNFEKTSQAHLMQLSGGAADFATTSTCSSFAQSNVPTSTHSPFKNLNQLLYPEKSAVVSGIQNGKDANNNSNNSFEAGESPGKQTTSSTSSSDKSQPPIIVATLSPKNNNDQIGFRIPEQNEEVSNNNSMARQQERTERLEVDLRTAAMYLISVLVKISPDSMFPLWTTLFPDGDPILVKSQSAGTVFKTALGTENQNDDGATFLDSCLNGKNDNENNTVATANNNNKSKSKSSSTLKALLPPALSVANKSKANNYATNGAQQNNINNNNRCTILSPLLGDDVRVRCAAIYTLVSIVAAVSNTLAVVPLESAANATSNGARATSPVARNPNHNSNSSSSAILHKDPTSNYSVSVLPSSSASSQPQQYQSDISRLGSVLHQIFRTLIAALNFQEINVTKAKKEICDLIPQYVQASREQNDQTSDTPTTATAEKGYDPDAANKKQLYKLLISAKAFDYHMSAVVHTLLLHAVGSLSVVVPLHRTPSISRLLFSYMETNFFQAFVTPMKTARWLAKKDGGNTLDHELTAAAFLLTAIHNSAGSRQLVRNFYKSTKAAPVIFEAVLDCLPHIDVWKFSSAVARNHPDIFRKYLWRYFFPESKNLFSPGSAYSVVNDNENDNDGKVMKNQGNDDDNVNSSSKRLKPVHVPYQAHLESLRSFIYFLGVRALPWERIQYQHQPLYHHYSLVPPNLYPFSTQQIMDPANNNNNLFIFIENNRNSIHSTNNNNNNLVNPSNAKMSSLLKHQQQQSQMAAFLSGGLLISAIPAFLHTSRHTRNKNVGEGVATNVAPLDLNSNQIVASDQRATTAEIIRIVKEIALPAMKSGIENVRCVATRIIAAIRNSFYEDCLKNTSETAKHNSSAISSPSPPFFTKQEIEVLIIKTILDKCKGDVDEARLEALTAAYCFVAVTPALAQIANKKVSSVVCDELIARKGLLSGEGKTRACQIVEALSSRILKYTSPTDEEGVANECSRIIRACVNVLSTSNVTPTALATTSSGRVLDEVVTQVASMLRSISFAVSTLPEDYLFMEVGSRGDDAVSWAFSEIFNQVEKVCVKDSRLFNALQKDNIAISKQGEIFELTINDTQATILCSAFESLSRLCCVNPEVADCDQQSVSKTIDVILPNAIALFSLAPDLSRNLYFVAGTAVRAIASIVNVLEIESSSSPSEILRRHVKSLFSVATLKNILKFTIQALFRALHDADVTRTGLHDDFVECCDLVLRLVVKHFINIQRTEKIDWIIFSSSPNNDNNTNEENEEIDLFWRYQDLLEKRFSSENDQWNYHVFFSLPYNIKNNNNSESENTSTRSESHNGSRPQSNSPSKSRERNTNNNNQNNSSNNNNNAAGNNNQDDQQHPQAYVPNPRWTLEENAYQEERTKAKALTNFVAQYD